MSLLNNWDEITLEQRLTPEAQEARQREADAAYNRRAKAARESPPLEADEIEGGDPFWNPLED